MKNLAELLEHPFVRAITVAVELVALIIAVWAGLLAKGSFDDQRVLNAYQIISFETSSNEAKWAAARTILDAEGSLRGLTIKCAAPGEQDRPVDFFGACAVVKDLTLGGDQRIKLEGVWSSNTIFENGSLRNVDMKVGDLTNSSFSGTTIYEVNFSSMTLHNMSFYLKPKPREGNLENPPRMPWLLEWWADRFSAVPTRVRPRIRFYDDDLSATVMTGEDLRDIAIENSDVSSMVIVGKMDPNQLIGKNNFYIGSRAPQIVEDGKGVLGAPIAYACPVGFEFKPGQSLDLKSDCKWDR